MTNEALKEQTRLFKILVEKSGISVVSCGNCGSHFLHSINNFELTCPHCLVKDDICFFPDLYPYTY